MRSLIGIAGGLAIVVVTAAPALAQTASAPPVPEATPWVETRGFASVGYSFNFGRPATGTNQLRVFDFDDDRLKVDVAELVLTRPATDRGEFGFRADLLAGSSVPRVAAASGLFRDRTTGEVSPGAFDIQQAYVSYLAPIGSGLRIDGGKFTTHIGAEVIEGYDGYGDTYTRGLLFGYAEPATHTGVRIGYTLTPKVSAMLLVVNGWDNVLDNNGRKSIGAQLAVTPSDRVTVYANYLGGAERADSNDARHLIDLVAVAKAGESVTLTFSYDYGRERNAVGPAQAGVWQGASASVKADLTSRYSVSWRGEIFADRSGVRTGTPQTLAEATVTPWLRVSRHLILRSDLRLDRSTEPVFESRDRLARHQATIAVNALVVF